MILYVFVFDILYLGIKKERMLILSLRGATRKRVSFLNGSISLR